MAPPSGIVIDADVGQGAASPRSIDEFALARRECLRAVEHAGLRVVTSAALEDEWQRIPRGCWGARWIRQMRSRNRVVLMKPRPHRPTIAAIARDLRPHERPAARKDLHLVEAALGSDSRLLSDDDRARDKFRRIASSSGDLRRLLWVATRDDGALDWLRAGAPDDAAHRLGGTPAP